MGKDIYVRKDLVGNEELSELDFVLQDGFGYDCEKGDFHLINSIKNASIRQRVRYYVDTTPLKISDLEKLISKFKKKGATHIAMAHHSDHQGYEFSAFNIELADDELIQRYNDEQEKKKQLYKAHKQLSQKIEIIEKDIRNLKV